MSTVNIKKKELITDLSKKTGFSFNYSRKIINDLINIINLNIKSGSLNLKNIGSFKTLKKKKRLGRNPKTKQIFKINSRKSIKFTLSKSIALKLNKLLQ